MGADTFSPRQVIGVVSHLIRQLGSLSTIVGGTIGFSVEGAEWIVDLDVAGGDWRIPDDTVREMDLSTKIFATPDAFAALFLEPKLIQRYLFRGDLTVEGDRQKLVALSRLIGRSGSALTQRVRRQASSDRPKTRRRRKRP